MPIRTIEIICRPCPKCEYIAEQIKFSMRVLEHENQIKIPYELKFNTDLKGLSKFALTSAQTPVVLVNGNVEFAGKIETRFIKPKLTSLQKDY